MQIKKLFFLPLLLIFAGCETDTTVKISSADPLFSYQWYLENSGQKAYAFRGGSAGEDLKIKGAWEITRGRGINIAIVDTGIEHSHPDLAENIDITNSAAYYNAKPYTTDPSPVTGDPTHQLDWYPVSSAHGTACAGIAAAVGNNRIGIHGVASEATLIGLNAFADLSKGQYLSFADALYNAGRPVDVSSNSWTDLPGGLADTSSEINSTLQGILYGRNGKGVVYCFAAGNFRWPTAEMSDNANWYRELSTPYVITVAALNATGRYASYSNFGANILVSGFGGEYGGSDPAIVTTDLSGSYGFDSTATPIYESDFYQKHFNVSGNENAEYTHRMNGTSAATPMIAGVAALMLAANPALTYRDLRYILATTARKNDPADSDWEQNGAGHWINHNYGFGAVDAEAAVSAASTYQDYLDDNMTRSYDSGSVSVTLDDTGTIERNISVPDDMLLEHVELHLQLAHDFPGDLNITLISPAGTTSLLSHTNEILNDLTYRGFFYDYHGHNGFTMGSVRCLDENASGTWRLRIDDMKANDPTTYRNDGGTLFRYKLILHGRAP